MFHEINVANKEVTVFGGLSEGKGLFSKFILVKRQRKVYQERGTNWGGRGIFLRIYLLPFKKLCMVVSSSKVIIIDSTCGISLRLLRKFQNDRFSGAANGNQNWNIMKLAHVTYHWKGNLMLINFYKRSTPLK